MVRHDSAFSFTCWPIGSTSVSFPLAIRSEDNPPNLPQPYPLLSAGRRHSSSSSPYPKVQIALFIAPLASPP